MRKIIYLCLFFAILGCTADDIPLEETLATRSVLLDGQTIFSDQTVEIDKMVTGTDIYSENVTVTNGALLTLKGTNSVTINKTFAVDKGSRIEISH